MRRLVITAVALFGATAAHAGMMRYTVPSDVSAGYLNMRSGPGVNHALIGSIPAGGSVVAERCAPRDDGLRGADWCLVHYGPLRGWASQAGLMPDRSRPDPVPLRVPLMPSAQPLTAVPAPLDAFETPAGYRQVAGWHVLRCYPQPDPSDRNPPTDAWVGFELTPDNILLNMTVSYDLANGGHVERSEQYGAVAGNDGVVYGWTGTYVRDPSKRMAGGAFFGSDGGWHYREKQWERGVVQYDHIIPCGVVDAVG